MLVTDFNHVYWAANVLLANLTDSKDSSGERLPNGVKRCDFCLK